MPKKAHPLLCKKSAAGKKEKNFFHGKKLPAAN